jgi:hypothetical protein
MDEETLTVWLDTALLMLGGFILMTVLMLSVVNPPAKSAETVGEQSPGNVIVEAQWADGVDADVDLWVEAPGDKPVGYSNKSGQVFNLLRDDLGKAQDVTDYNYEVAYSRGMPAGEYVVNVHMYRGIGVTYPITVKLVASVKDNPQDTAQQVVTTTVQLHHENEQVTAFRFSLDSQGHPVQGTAGSRSMIISAAAVAFALLLGTFIFLVLPRGRLWQRATSATVFLVLIAVVYGGSIELLSRPKPLRLELWQEADKAKVLGASMREGEAIYVWLQFPGTDEPRAYILPWDMKMAQQLQNAMQEGQSNGTDVNMSKPFDSGLDDREPKFYATPQQALPDKNYSGGDTLVFEPTQPSN